jgi:putative ABC transport system permease protein
MEDIVASTIAQPHLAGVLTESSPRSAFSRSSRLRRHGVDRRSAQAEVGVRMALGADRAAILRLIIGQGMRVAVTGIAAGSWRIHRRAAARPASLRIEPRDLMVFALTTAAVIGVALAANFVPAHRAASLDPTVPLRQS